MLHAPWRFWVDRGGTFTDIVARKPVGTLVTHKLLPSNPEQYRDAAVAGIRHLLQVPDGEPMPVDRVAEVRMGTTVATNALLERKGQKTVLAVTRGFREALRIAYQDRPRIFNCHIQLPELLYSHVIEIVERLGAHGEILTGLDKDSTCTALKRAYDEGYRSIAIVLMHGYRHPQHELEIANMARAIGYGNISASHEVSPMIKLVSRGDTTTVDAYLSPLLRRYVEQISTALKNMPLCFMQSNGGLAEAQHFRGKDAILSGPAGGVVGAVRTALAEVHNKLIGFDMGGSSTDVWHFSGCALSDMERSFETRVAGVRMRVPMMNIHTVAAGGGSILHFDGARSRVGPESAGAHPGPACYRRGGPLTLADCNVMLGRLLPEYFPAVFGADGKQSLDTESVAREFRQLARHMTDATGHDHAPEHIAAEHIEIAISNLANAIKRISVQRGHDVSDYTLCCFGGAAGQHACQVADALGMKRILIHPLAGVLSAYGIGLADLTELRVQSVEVVLADGNLHLLQEEIQKLSDAADRELQLQGVLPQHIKLAASVHIRYEGTDTALPVAVGDIMEMKNAFESAYRMRYSFLMPARTCRTSRSLHRSSRMTARPLSSTSVHAAIMPISAA